MSTLIMDTEYIDLNSDMKIKEFVLNRMFGNSRLYVVQQEPNGLIITPPVGPHIGKGLYCWLKFEPTILVKSSKNNVFNKLHLSDFKKGDVLKIIL